MYTDIRNLVLSKLVRQRVGQWTEVRLRLRLRIMKESGNVWGGLTEKTDS